MYSESGSNAEIYEENVAKSVRRVLNGYNAVVFAYGQTSSGKTHTMSGSADDMGIIGRAAHDLFGELDKQTTGRWKVAMSYLEIYNEKVYDLLETKNADLPIRENTDRTIFVPGLSQEPIRTAQDFERVYESGCFNRRSAPTALNVSSSRSHAVLMLTVRQRRADGTTLTGKLYLVDLAGSEDNRHTGNTGMRMTESSSINTSLFVLGQVVDSLAENKGRRVPYRDSKLTRLLSDSLGGSAYSLLIANVAPGIEINVFSQSIQLFSDSLCFK